MDQYYQRSEISNSDLSWLKKYWLPESQVIDLEKAYRFGTLIDCMLTEPDKVNYFKLTCAEYSYTKEEFERAAEMKKAFQRDAFCAMLLKQACCQKISVREEFEINYDGFSFKMPVRCKWDGWIEKLHWGFDIKSTAATTQKQFEECVRYFEYTRQRSWYMDIEQSNSDILIGISKTNFKIFKVPVKRGDAIYNEGKRLYEELAFKYWYLFMDINTAA